MTALPAAKRALLILRRWYTEPISAIGRRYGMRNSTVSMTLSRLHRKLRVHLQIGGFEP